MYFCMNIQTLWDINMNELDNITKLLKEQKKTQKGLCSYLGISGNVFTEWKARRNFSYRKYLPEIASYLGVSVDSLLEKDRQTEPRETSVALSAHEKKLIEAYRKKPEMQSAVNKLLDLEDDLPH